MSSNANIALNQVGYQQLVVAGIPVGLTPPTYAGQPITVEHVIIRCVGQPVRWLAGAQGSDPTAQRSIPDGVMGIPLNAGETLTWLDPFTNYKAVIGTIKFVRDSTATANAILEIAYFQ
jgi:hypothetical protein